jgi:hypothetical protein
MPEDGSKVQWYESASFWGFFSLGAGIVIAVIAAMEKDIRWLFWLASPCFIVSAWSLFRSWLGGRPLWLCTFIAGLFIVGGLFWMNAWLRPKPEVERPNGKVELQSSVPPATAETKTTERPKPEKKLAGTRQTKPRAPVSQDCGGGNCAVSVGQQGGITAGAINVNSDRHLTDNQKAALVRVASLLTDGRFQVIAINDGEAERYAQEFYDVLTTTKKAKDSQVDISWFTRPPFPLELRANGIETESGTVLARKVASILLDSGIQIRLVKEEMPADMLEFVIGSR